MMSPQGRAKEPQAPFGARAAAGESFDEAARLLAATEAHRGRIGYARPSASSIWAKAQLNHLEAQMEADEFAARWAEGGALSLEETLAYATRARGERKRPSIGWESLTPTELDVVLLVAEGLTNKAIAERLFVAPSTIKTHLSSIFTKLGVTTRSELTAAAIRRATNGGP